MLSQRLGSPYASRWILKHSANHHSDLVVLARFDEHSRYISDYFLAPGVVLDNPQQMIMDANHLEIGSFQSESLAPLAALFARKCFASGPANYRVGSGIASAYLKTARNLPVLQLSRSLAKPRICRR